MPLNLLEKPLQRLVGADRNPLFEGLDRDTEAILETMEGLVSGRDPDLDEATRHRLLKSLGQWRKRWQKDEEKHAHSPEFDEDEK